MDEKFELLLNLKNHLSYLHGMVGEIVENLRQGDEFGGSSGIIKFIDELNVSIEAINITKDIQKETIEASEINEILSSLVEALSNQDFILICDLFEYEVTPILEDWEKKISSSVLN